MAKKTTTENWRLLVAAIAKQAVHDLASPDVLIALDSLEWFLDGGAAELLAEIDILPNSNLLEKAVRNG